jgi:pyruvate/2-oxoglutarate dehydrogenase complex dihydrolipoamide acyltransferase (E2) component
MNGRRLVWLVLAAVIALSAALWLSGRWSQGSAASGALVPGLDADLGSVNAVTIYKGGPEPVVTLQRAGDQWTVAQRGDYPADVAKLRKLLIALGDAKVREEKTRDPANYGLLGVADPRKAGATGAEVDLRTPSGTRAIIIGKATVGGNFARRIDAAQSVIVEPPISFETEPRFWIDPRITTIPLASITRIDLQPADGPAYALRRSAPAATAANAASTASPDSATAATPASTPASTPSTGGAAEARGFELDSVPKGRKPAAAALLAPSSTAFSDMTAEDVSAADRIDFGKASKATLTLSNGKTITITGTVTDGKHWIELQSTQDPGLDAKLKAHAYELSADRYGAIFRPLDVLLEPLPAPPAAPPQRTLPGNPKAAHGGGAAPATTPAP